MSKISKKIIFSILTAMLIAFGFVFANAPQTKASVYASMSQTDLISTGTIVNNTILFAFEEDKDRVFKNGAYTTETLSFINRFNGLVNTGNNSLQQYYKEISAGALTVESNLVMEDANNTPNNPADDTPFVVFLDISKTVETTLESTNAVTDTILSELSTKNTTFKTSGIDNNNDDRVDVLTYVYLSFEVFDKIDEANNKYEAINNEINSGSIGWPHRSSYNGDKTFSYKGSTYNYRQMLVFGHYCFETYGVPQIDNYLSSTFFHEFGHALGLPDVYCRDNGNIRYTDYWDLMGSNCGQSISAYFKYKLGWTNAVNMTEITTRGSYNLQVSNINELNYVNNKSLSALPQCFYVRDSQFPNQLIVLEYRSTKTGRDANLSDKSYQDGLLIYRVNENRNSNDSLVLDSNKTNYVPLYYFRNTPGNLDISSTRDISFQAGETFGNDTTTEPSNDINTQFISFVNDDPSGNDGTYANSNLVVTVNSIQNGILNFSISGGELVDNTGEGTLLNTIISDQNLLEALAEIVHSTKNSVTIGDVLNNITSELDLSNKGITDLTGLNNISFTSLTSLNLSGNKIETGLGFVSCLTTLTKLQMSNCGLTNIDFLIPLNNLQYIDISCNEIENFEVLESLFTNGTNNLQFVNIVLNNLDTSDNDNIFILGNQYDGMIMVGVQNYPKNELNIGLQSFYYKSFTTDNPNISLSITITEINTGITLDLVDGENIIGHGSYEINYSFSYMGTLEETTFESTINVIVLSLKEPIVELIVGQGAYNTDTEASFNNWDSNICNLISSTITYDDGTGPTGAMNVNTSQSGTYFITFTIVINETEEIQLVKQIIVYENEFIAYGEAGISDTVLYRELLRLVGKEYENAEAFGTTMNKSLYSQDLYFYNEMDIYITELNLQNKGIQSLTGIDKFNLARIKRINLNFNPIADISALVADGSKTLPSIENLELCSIGLTSLPEKIGELYTLKTLDLSFNKLNRVDALKPLVLSTELQQANKEQTLEFVNLNCNYISFDEEGKRIIEEDGKFRYITTPNLNYNEINSFIKSTEALEGFKSPDQIFIVLIQNLPPNSSYVSYNKNFELFDYVPTRANIKIKNNVPTYRFTLQLNGSDRMQEWEMKNTKDMFTTPGAITIKFVASKDLNPFAYNPTKNQNITFYLSQVSIKTLKEINNKTFTFENQWQNYQWEEPKWQGEPYYRVLTTETLKHPTQSDLYILSGVPNSTDSFDAFEYEAYYIDASKTKHVINDLSTFSNNGGHDVYVQYKIKIEGTTTTGENVLSLSEYYIRYRVDYVTNSRVTSISDTNLETKLRSILNKTDTSVPLYKYDTYNLKRLDLSNCGIESLAGISNFDFYYLTYLNLSNNKLKNINSTINANSLKYCDVSMNALYDSSELKSRFTTNEPMLYITAFMNLYNFNPNIVNNVEYAQKNQWLFEQGTYTNNQKTITVFTGIQGINKTETKFITFGNTEISSVIGSTAGYYFVDKNLALGVYSIDQKAKNDPFSPGENYHYNFFHYLTECSQSTLTFNFRFEELSFKYQGTINHQRVYHENTVLIVDYDRENNPEVVNEVQHRDCLKYINSTSDDFIIDYGTIIQDEVLLDTIHINELTSFVQEVVVLHKETQRHFVYVKEIYVLDREKPVLSMEGEGVVRTLINNPYSFYEKDKIDRDISVFDNYDLTNLAIVATIKNSKGEEIVQDSIPIDEPDIYTITYTATDSSGNVSDPLIRKVKVEYNAFENIKITKPQALLYVGENTFQVTVYRNDATKDLYPTFNWYVDGKLVATSYKDTDLAKPDMIITSTVNLPFDNAGKHNVEVKINENTDEDFTPLVEMQLQSCEYFVLLDQKTSIVLVIIVVALIILAIIVGMIIRKKNKKREIKVSKYEYNIISNK